MQIFVLQSQYPCMHKKCWDLVVQKDSRVALMIIEHKCFHIIHIDRFKNERKNKVASAVELSIIAFKLAKQKMNSFYNCKVITA